MEQSGKKSDSFTMSSPSPQEMYATTQSKSSSLNLEGSSSKVGAVLSKISQSKPNFWRPTTKVPGTIKSVGLSPESTKSTIVKGAQYTINVDKVDSFGKQQQSQVNGEPISERAIESTPTKLQNGVSPTPSPQFSKRNSASRTDTPSTLRIKKFGDLLAEDNVDLTALRKLAWQGIPNEFRAMVWKLLLEYLPTNKDRRAAALERKRKEYCDCIPRYFDIDDAERTVEERGIFRQIQLDVPRTSSSVFLFQSKIVQQSLGRILYIWSIRHPASGYVQGINDLVTTFFVVFLREHVGQENVENFDVSQLSATTLSTIEADSYWCLSRLLDGIQDNYTFAQLGIQRACHKLSEIVHRVDAPLHDHLKQQQIVFIQFAFRWINCLLMRELPLQLVIRVWDTYAAEVETFGVFHVYVCAAFLVRFSEDLRQVEFQDIMLFLKNPPTNNWGNTEIELLLSQAYMWQTLFEDSPKHLEET